MKKVFILIAIISVSAIAASAQTKANGESGDPHQDKVAAQKTSPRTRKVRKEDPRVLRLGPSTTYLREGLSINEVVRVLGKPTSVSERQDGNLRLATYTFPRSEGRVLRAEFENDVLVSSRTETVEEVAQTTETGK